jgi:hypothetical protein
MKKVTKNYILEFILFSNSYTIVQLNDSYNLLHEVGLNIVAIRCDGNGSHRIGWNFWMHIFKHVEW